MQNNLIAAIDLGSNSFRLQVAREEGAQVYPLDGFKESVRLAAGLDADHHLDEAAQQRGLAALARFAERLRGFAPTAVRVVATNTLRVARNAQEFLARGEAVLGFPIEVIAGREEARLIHLGVAHVLPAPGRRQLIVDIGGGSTEFIIGEGVTPLQLESLYMGCVAYSLRFFPGGLVDHKRFRAAELAARQEIQTIAQTYRRTGWDEAVGSSGTAKALAELLAINKLNPEGREGLTLAGLEALEARLIKAGSAEKLVMEGIKADRIPVLPGGLAIMLAVFRELGLTEMNYSNGALQLGVLYDLLGRTHHADLREATVQQFMRRYKVDLAQAKRVEETALRLLATLDPATQDADHPDHRFLRWAAALHEIGVSIAHAGYHKHGAYILANADMPGFARSDQARLSLLALAHRGKLERVTNGAVITGATVLLPRNGDWRLVFCLRIAAVLHRARSSQSVGVLAVKEKAGGFQLSLDKAWLDAAPLTAAALSDEVAPWQAVGVPLTLVKRRNDA